MTLYLNFFFNITIKHNQFYLELSIFFQKEFIIITFIFMFLMLIISCYEHGYKNEESDLKLLK